MSKLKDDRTNLAKAETLVTNGGFRKGDNIGRKMHASLKETNS